MRRPGVGVNRRSNFRGVGGGAPAAVLPVGPSIVFDYDGSHYTDAGGGRISALLDQSSAGNNASQPTAANRPLAVVGGGPGGRDAIDYALLAGAATFVDTGNISLTANITLYTVAQKPTIGRYIADGIALNTRVLYSNGASNKISMYSGNVDPVIAEAMVDGTWYVIAAKFNGATSRLVVDRIGSDTGDVGAFTSLGLTLGGAFGTNATFCHNVRAARYIGYNAAHSDAVMDSIVAYLRAWASL